MVNGTTVSLYVTMAIWKSSKNTANNFFTDLCEMLKKPMEQSSYLILMDSVWPTLLTRKVIVGFLWEIWEISSSKTFNLPSIQLYDYRCSNFQPWTKLRQDWSLDLRSIVIQSHLNISKVKAITPACSLSHPAFLSFSLANYPAHIFVNIVRPFLGTFLEKVEIFGPQRDKWIPNLLKKIPRDALPKYYGGILWIPFNGYNEWLNQWQNVVHLFVTLSSNKNADY